MPWKVFAKLALVASLAVLTAVTSWAVAQQPALDIGRIFAADLPEDDMVPNFQFARVQFTSFRMRRRPGWAHDYPRAEQNFLRILSEVTAVHTSPRSYTIVRLDGPEIMNYPILYFSEPGTWAITSQEAENFREYLLRGGFAIFDDFDGPYDWEVFESAMARVLPGRHFERLEVSDPIFQCFFHLETLDIPAPGGYRGWGGYGGGGDRLPVFYGLRDDEGTLKVVVNFNNDIGDYWEWSDTGFYPMDLSNEGYKLGINYIVYALTH